MAARTIVVYNGPAFPSGTANAATSIVERDTDGSINVGPCNATQVNSGGVITQTLAATQTTTFTVNALASILPVDASGASVTVNLPPAASVPGRIYTVVKINSANSVIVDGSGSETISGATTKTLTTQWTFIRIVSDGTNWLQIG